MNFYTLLLSCALPQDPSAPGSAAEGALNAQFEAGEHARTARNELEALEEVLTQDGLSEADLLDIRARLEAAKVARAEAELALDKAEAALGTSNE